MNRHEIETQLIEQANVDPAFRRHLLDDPKAALSDLLGMTLPPGMEITVLEEQPGQHYLVLPPAPPSPDALRLDDLELSLVGGGRTLRPILMRISTPNTRRAQSGNITRSSC